MVWGDLISQGHTRTAEKPISTSPQLMPLKLKPAALVASDIAGVSIFDDRARVFKI